MVEKINFPKNLVWELQPATGEIILDPHERLTVLKQDHFAFEDERVIEIQLSWDINIYMTS